MLYLHLRATFTLTLSVENQHLTHLQRFSVSGRLHSGTCSGDGPFWAKVQSRRARQARVREVSLRRRLRQLLQHQGHGQPQSKSFKAELPSETASPKPPRGPLHPVLSRDPQSLFGRNLFISLSAKPGESMDGDVGPHSPQQESPSSWPARLFHPHPPPKKGQMGAHSVETLQRPEPGQGEFVFPSPSLGKLSGPPLRLSPAHLAITRPSTTTPCPGLSSRKNFYKPLILHENFNPYRLAYKSHRHKKEKY